MIGTKIGPTEIALLIGIVLLLFGPSKLPELAKAVGKSITELKNGLKINPSKEEDEDHAGSTSSTPTEEI